MSSEQGLESTIARLQAIEGFDFEEFVAEFFEEDGWDTEVTQQTDDDGIDVIAERTSVIEERAVIQAKRHAPDNKVEFGDVQRYSALKYDEHQNDMAVVVTTSSFTKKAYNWAREKNVKLMDGAAIAGYLIANDRTDLIDDYATRDVDHSGQDIFQADESSRENYYRDRPMKFAANIFEEQKLLDALETIDTTEVGTALINSLDDLRSAINNSPESPPTGMFLDSPRLLDGNWYDVDISGEISDDINNSATMTSPSGPPRGVEVVCFGLNDELKICNFLPVNQPIERRHLSYAEDCFDFILNNYDYHPTEVGGFIIGDDIECVQAPGTKFHRLREYSFTMKSYEDLLTKSVRTNRELLRAVEPYFRSSQNREMLEKLNELNSFT